MSGRSRISGVLATAGVMLPLSVGAFFLGAAAATSGITARSRSPCSSIPSRRPNSSREPNGTTGILVTIRFTGRRR